MWVFAGWCDTACSLVCLRFRVVVLFVGILCFWFGLWFMVVDFRWVWIWWFLDGWWYSSFSVDQGLRLVGLGFDRFLRVLVLCGVL